MPTGYTAEIQDGKVDFKTFALHCARASVACIMQRDDNSNDLPQEQTASDYHTNNVKEAHQSMALLLSFTPEQMGDAAKSAFQDKMQYYNDAIAQAIAIKGNYEVMLKQVNAWMPPTTEHQWLKSFMQKQIEDSIRWDCDTSYYEKNKPVLLSAQEYFEKRRTAIQCDIDYHTKEYQVEVERTDERNKWIKDLYKSLNK